MDKIYKIIFKNDLGHSTYQTKKGFLKGIASSRNHIKEAKIYTASETLSEDQCLQLVDGEEKAFIRGMKISSLTGEPPSNINKEDFENSKLANDFISFLELKLKGKTNREGFHNHWISSFENELKRLDIKDRYNFKKVKRLIATEYKKYCFRLCESVEDFEKLLKINNFRSYPSKREMINREENREEKIEMFLKAKESQRK